MTPGVEKRLNEYGYMIWKIDAIAIDGNYDYQFVDNIKVSPTLKDKKYMDLDFNDFVEFTEFEIPADSEHVKILIDEVYKGTKYNDICVTKTDVFYYMKFLD